MLVLIKYNRRHEATFPPGALDKHYEKLLLNDERLARVSRRLFLTNGSVLPLQQIPQQQQLPHEPTFVGSSSQNPIVVSNDMAAPFIPPPSSCPPKFQHGLIEVEYSDAGEQALADAIVREANETRDAFAWSLIEVFAVQGQGNEPVGGGNVNEHAIVIMVDTNITGTNGSKFYSSSSISAA